MLDYLVGANLAQKVPAVDPSTGKELDKYYSLGMGTDGHHLDSMELLTAIVPSGVVCYFSALQIHDLTTQIPTQHHIARINSKPSKPIARTPVSTRTQTTNTKRKKPNLLGKLQCEYEGIPYYLTTRAESKVPGRQCRYFNSQVQMTVTDIEQTLLDTLHRPLSCGGPNVVFEVWKTVRDRLNEDRLLTHLVSIQDSRLVRRVAYMIFDALDYPVGSELSDYLMRSKPAKGAVFSESPISLLPGMTYERTNDDWQLMVP